MVATASGVTPLMNGASLPDEELLLKKAPHQHSWRYAPPWGTALSCLFFVMFFYQPHWLRVQLWQSVRSRIEDERTFMLVGALIVHIGIFVLANGCMTLIYYLQLPFFEQYKIQPTPWPWNRGPAERAAYFSLIRKTLLLLSFNLLVLQPLGLWLGYAGQKQRGMNADVETVPTWYESLGQICVCMLIEDTLFYWAHRTLHHPKIYASVHKVHHQYKTSIGIASEYAHPIEFVFSNVIPFTAGPLLLGCHYFTLWQWTLLRIGETVDGHCGYEFPWSPYRLLPFSGSSTAHDFHHSHNVGNFGSFFTFWDQLCGTDAAFIRWEKKQAAAKQIKEAQARAQAGQGLKKEAGASPTPTTAGGDVKRA